MTSAVPGIIAWPLIAFMGLVVVVRYRWFNTNLYDTYLNNTQAFLLLAQLLREHFVENVLSRSALMTITAAQQISFVAMIFAATEFIGFTTLSSGLAPAATRCHHRYYRVAAGFLSSAYLIAATRARLAGQTLEVSGGWDGVLAWVFYLTMLSVLSEQLLYMCVSELRKNTYCRERLVAAGGLFLGAIIGATVVQSLVLAVSDQLGWTDTVDYRLYTCSFDFFFEAVGASAISAVPCVMKLLAYCGLDPVSRSWVKLQPLRQSMRTVVPEWAFEFDHDDQRRQKSTLQLHQTAVEIRDAILQLRPYFPDLPRRELDQFLDANAVPAGQRNVATCVLHLAHAVRAKAAGVIPEPLDAAVVVASRSRTLDEETAELLEHAKWWPVAYAAAEQSAPSFPDVKVNPASDRSCTDTTWSPVPAYQLKSLKP